MFSLFFVAAGLAKQPAPCQGKLYEGTVAEVGEKLGLSWATISVVNPRRGEALTLCLASTDEGLTKVAALVGGATLLGYCVFDSGSPLSVGCQSERELRIDGAPTLPASLTAWPTHLGVLSAVSLKGRHASLTLL